MIMVLTFFNILKTLFRVLLVQNFTNSALRVHAVIIFTLTQEIIFQSCAHVTQSLTSTKEQEVCSLGIQIQDYACMHPFY